MEVPGVVPTLGQLGLDPSALDIGTGNARRAFLGGSNLRLTIARLHPALESSNLPGMPTKANPLSQQVHAETAAIQSGILRRSSSDPARRTGGK